MGAERVESLLAVDGGKDPVAHLRQELLRGQTHGLIVLHQQDRFRPAGEAFVGDGLELRHPPIAHGGEVHLGRRALPDLTVDVQVAAVLLHEAVRHGHAEAGADAHGLGGEERLEHSSQGLRVHPDAGVAQRDADVGPGLDPGVQRPIGRPEPRAPHFDVQRAAVPHGVPGVGHEVQQDLLHCGGIGFDDAAVLVRLELHLDVGRKLAPQRVERAAHELGEDQRLQVEHVVAAEAEEPLHQLGPALGRDFQLVEVAVRRQRLSQRRGARQDRREELVELLRDGARQPADRLHLIGLPQCPLARELRGDVFGGHSVPSYMRPRGRRQAGRTRATRGVSLSGSTRLELARYLRSGV